MPRLYTFTPPAASSSSSSTPPFVTMADDSGSLAYAPTWAVASVCFAFIVFSLIIERLIFAIGQWWIARKQLALVEALEKIKEELMVVGFISLALTVGAKYVMRICVPKEWINILPQCRHPPDILAQQESESLTNLPTGSACVMKGKAEFMHPESLHELHIFMFALAVAHVVYSVIIMALGRWKVYQWKTWEKLSCEMEIASIPEHCNKLWSLRCSALWWRKKVLAIWECSLPLKERLFVWRCLMGVLPVGSFLQARRIASSRCARCSRTFLAQISMLMRLRFPVGHFKKFFWVFGVLQNDLQTYMHFFTWVRYWSYCAIWRNRNLVYLNMWTLTLIPFFGFR